MQITGLHHLALLTPDLARLRDFYVEQLGFRPIGGFADDNIHFLAAGNVTIELEEGREAGGPARGRGWHHLALEVEDVDAAYAELAARGVPFQEPPAGFPPEAPLLRIAFLADPDGNLLELVQPLGRRYPPLPPAAEGTGPRT